MSESYLKGGWRTKYVITKIDGTPVDPDAVYFVLRLDEDPHARVAAKAYANSVRPVNQELAEDLDKLIETYVDYSRLSLEGRPEPPNVMEWLKVSLEIKGEYTGDELTPTPAQWITFPAYRVSLDQLLEAGVPCIPQKITCSAGVFEYKSVSKWGFGVYYTKV